LSSQQNTFKAKTANTKRGFAMFLMIVCCITISIGPLLFRNMESADIWQINIYRSVSWISALLIILLFKYRSAIFSKILAIGRWGIIAGTFLASAQIFYMHALDNTTVANVLFILSAIPFVTAIIAYLFISEKIKLPTIFMMAFAAIGIIIMVSEGINSGNAFGNSMAIITLLCFSCFPVILRNNRHIDMLPTLLVPALIIGITGLIIKGNQIQISNNDLVLSCIWGGLLNGFAHSIFIIATRHLLAAEITLFMLLEFSLGPLWVWYFIGETPAVNTLLGGSIVMTAIAFLTFYELLKRRKLNNIIKDIGWDESSDNNKIEINNKSEDKLSNEEMRAMKEIQTIKNSDDQISEKIGLEVEKQIIPSLHNWMDKNLKKMLKKNIEDQFNNLKKEKK
jgi:drug/metabolite transporter (DMT)-like permease